LPKLSRLWPAAVLLLSMAAAGFALVFAPDVRSSHRKALSANAPTLAKLNQATSEAADFIEALYRPLGEGRAAASEYFALPIRVYLPRSHRWILAGQSRSRSSVSQTESAYSRESFDVSFTGLIALRVTTNWRRNPSSYVVSVRQLTAARQPIVVYLDERRLGTGVSRRPLAHWTLLVPSGDRTPLRSFRYTVRHGAQLAQNFYRYRGDTRRFAATAALIRSGNFQLNSDLTAPIWGQGVQFKDDLPFDPNESYHDCSAKLPATPTAYPYRSKVCSTSRGLYIWLSHSDPLVPAATALHVLERDHDPNRKIHAARLPIAVPVGADIHAAEPPARSPRETAAWIESIYRGTGFGVPRCLPAHCEHSGVSGVRTFEFGALEAMLGYRYGDKISRSYADAMAALTLKIQIGRDSILRTNNGNFYRPAARGSFVVGWDKTLRAYLTESLTSKVTHNLSMPPEYTGIIASNNETTITAYAFLVAYRCVRYHVRCEGLGAWRAFP
jgi:hypothetical protein